MNRPIDPDLDDRPNVHAMDLETLRRNLVSMSREFAEERTENRRLRKLLGPASLPIFAERTRQVELGFTAAHDDEHDMGEIVDAAICYAAVASAQARGSSADEWADDIFDGFSDSLIRWPWNDASWKPADDPKRNLVKAAALIVAEYERLGRLREMEESEKQEHRSIERGQSGRL